MTKTFHDELVGPSATGLPERFFDRFVFNAHRPDATDLSLLVGLGMVPGTDTVDGFVICSTAQEQRNLRFSTELSATDGRGVGPFAFSVVEPMRSWRLTLQDNPIGLTFDLTWQARAPAWFGTITIANDNGSDTSFDHLFQSGRYDGTVSLDGQPISATGWYGQRDRSRGVRTMAGGQGLHIWYQAQFPDRSVGFLLVEGRDGSRLLLEGAVMHTDGTLDPILEVTHDLVFDQDLDLKSGLVRVTTAGGRRYDIDTDASGGGGLMSGGGYGGDHGRRLGRDHLEHDVYSLDGTVTQRTVDTSLTDRLAAFDWAGTPGIGIFEFALTRSPAYRYQPTLR